MVSKWEIYYCNLNPAVGSEQRGTRPVVVISSNDVNHNLPVSTVIPLSSINPGDKIYAMEVEMNAAITGLPKNSVAMLQQIRTVSHKRLTNLCGKITDIFIQREIENALRSYFDLSVAAGAQCQK